MKPQPMIHIKPAAGQRLRDPFTGAVLPAEGGRVRRSTHWLKRLRDNEAELVDDKPVEHKKADKPREVKP